MDNSNTKKDSLMSISIMAAAVLIAGAIIYSAAVRKDSAGRQEASLTPSSEIPVQDETNFFELLDTDIVLGEADAPITWIEYGDYQCPFCNKLFRETDPLIRENYVRTGKVKMIWRDFSFLGKESDDAALAARCAGDQGKFWEYHDAIHYEEIKDQWKENNGNLSEKRLKAISSELALDREEFDKCFDSRKYDDLIGNYYSEAVKAGIGSTPTVFVNGEKVEGALPFSSFESIIEAQLKNNL